MPTDPANRLIDHIFRCMSPGDGDKQTDGELLSRFIERHDEAALAAIVRRHAGMVWGICNRALQSHQDAEDAFQATFLVLVRKATSIVPRGNVGNWLYGVANQVTTHAKRGIARRRTREVQVIEMPDTPAQSGLSLDLRFVLDEELVRLPDIYRAVVVLCDLEGRTRSEVARLLGVPDGTVGGRLARARALLAERLTRRGVAFSSGSMAVALSAGTALASVPPALVASTIRDASLLAAGQATGVVSAKVAALTEGVVKAMFVSKLKAALSAVLLLGLLATGGTLLAYRTASGQDEKKPVAEKPVDTPVQPEKKREPIVFWGKEVGGLQAGLSVLPGGKRIYHHGETATLAIRIRNNGKQTVKFEYLKQFFMETPPSATDGDGKPIPHMRYEVSGEIHEPTEVRLEPGKQIELYELKLELKPGKRIDPNSLRALGKISIQYERLFGNTGAGQIKLDPDLSKLATGTVELEVKEAKEAQRPADPQGKKEAEGFTAWGEEVGGRPRATVERYLAAALAGRVDEAVGLAVKGTSPRAPADRKQVAEFRKRVVGSEVRLWTVLAAWDAGEAVAVTEEFRWVEFQPAEKESPNVAAPPQVNGQPEGTRVAYVSAVQVFKVVKSGDRWLVKDADITTEKDALNRVEAFKAKHPAATAVPARDDDKHSAAPARVRELQKERIATLNEAAESSRALAKQGRGEFGEALDARMALLQAELEFAEQEADRVALCKKALESMKELEQLAVARKAAAQGTEVDILKAKAKRLEIEIALARFK